MARLARLVIPGLPHLVVQRGHNRQPVFDDVDDRRAYLSALREASTVTGVAIHAYALLDAEVLLLVMPGSVDALGKFMQAVSRRYVSGYNARHGRVGTLWEGRYRATVIEPERHFIEAMRYIEHRAGAPAAESFESGWRWSSAPHHLGKSRDPLLSDHPLFWQLGNTPFEREAAYNLLLTQGLSEAAGNALQSAVEKGWALGADTFVAELQAASARRLVPLKRGRPARRAQD